MVAGSIKRLHIILQNHILYFYFKLEFPEILASLVVM